MASSFAATIGSYLVYPSLAGSGCGLSQVAPESCLGYRLPPMTGDAENITLFPFEHPVHFTVRDLRITSELDLSGEAGEREAPICKMVAGTAKLDDRHGAMVDGSAVTTELSLAIESDEYTSIVALNRELRDQFGDDFPRDFHTNDTLATGATISHVEREVSEVGVLWEEKWTLYLKISHSVLESLIDAIRYEGVNTMALSVQFKNLLTDQNHEEFKFFFDRKPDHLHLEKVSPWGYVTHLSFSHQPTPITQHQFEQQQTTSFGRKIMLVIGAIFGWLLIISLGLLAISFGINLFSS